MEREIESLEEIKEGDEKNIDQTANRRSYGHIEQENERGFRVKEKGIVADELEIDWKQRAFSKRTQVELKKDLGQTSLGLF